MSLHRLSAGAGYQYLLRHTACGDVERDASTPLTAYYTASGYPPGRWSGTGLAGLGDGADHIDSSGGAGRSIAAGSVVREEQMAAIYGSGRDPITGGPLGKAYPIYQPAEARIALRTAALPPDLDPHARAEAVARITTIESERRMPAAVAGFDLTFTIPKSASVLWALGDPKTQAAIAGAHRAAVDDALAFLEERALFTRVGAQSCAQVPTRGMVAAAFDHWDTRTSDPNLHTHVVVANKVQGEDGRWRSVDSRALHHAVVSVSEIYDNLVADHLARELPVAWSWRPRGARRTPAFEIDGIGDNLLAAFSTRAAHIDVAVQEAFADFATSHGRGPNRVEVLRLRQQVTRSTRPAKTAHPLSQLLRQWRERATDLTGHSPEHLSEQALTGLHPGRRDSRRANRPLTSDQVSSALVTRLAGDALEEVMSRRSTWTSWNVLAEAARATRGLRMATTQDRQDLDDRVVAAALALSVSLEPPELFSVPDAYRRADGTSVFTRPGEHRFTHTRVLDAERRLLGAANDMTAPTASEATARRIATAPQQPRHDTKAVKLARDQVDAVVAIATSGRRLDVLVGPAGTGKTTTLRALRTAWEATHGRGSVIGLAPSAVAAAELATALNITCENTAKWLYESDGPGGHQRTQTLDTLRQRRAEARSLGDISTIQGIDTATHALRREQAAWELKPGQLVIVDEASLAGTFTLDTLATQVSTAGAKLLLVGDHKQLSAVDAGGGFGLLAETGPAHELRSLWRFRNRWEANASRLLRHGDPAALPAYITHSRISEGAAETMLEAAYTGWQDSERAGHTAVLVAADGHTVAALNTRAHDDRITAGLVDLDIGVPCAGDSAVCAGDRIITRLNKRTLRVPGRGYVRNGALWDVLATHPDGSLTVTPASRGVSPETEPGPAPQVTLPAAYVAEHVELGYATTIHRAQGLTVEHAHVLAAPGMTREALYVALTRGRSTNHVYVATDEVDPSCDIPDVDAGSTGQQVLTRIMATSGSELSATQTIRARQDAAGSLATLTPIRTTLIADADTRRWQRLLPLCGLDEQQTDLVLSSPAAGALLAALRAGESRGQPMTRVLRALVIGRAFDHPDDLADDIASVLHERVSNWLESAARRPPGPGGRQGTAEAPGITDDQPDPAHETIDDIDILIRRRTHSFAADAPHVRPHWLRPTQWSPSASTDPAPQEEASPVIDVNTRPDLRRRGAAQTVATDTQATRFEQRIEHP